MAANSGGNQSGKTPALESVVALVAPLGLAIGALAVSGPIGRVQRDAPELFAIAISVLVIGSGLWFLSSLPKPRAWQVASIAFLLVGFIGALLITIFTAANQPRPRISAALSDDRAKITANIRASSLGTDERLAIFVDGLTREKTGPEPTERLYRAFVGPDGDGNVEQAITLPLPNGGVTDVGIKAFTGSESPACDDFAANATAAQGAEEGASEKSKVGSGTGCVIVSLLPRQAP